MEARVLVLGHISDEKQTKLAAQGSPCNPLFMHLPRCKDTGNVSIVLKIGFLLNMYIGAVCGHCMQLATEARRGCLSP